MSQESDENDALAGYLLTLPTENSKTVCKCLRGEGGGVKAKGGRELEHCLGMRNEFCFCFVLVHMEL